MQLFFMSVGYHVETVARLRAFTFDGGRDCYFRDGGFDPAFMFSKVSVLVAFERYPAPSITLQTYNKRAFEGDFYSSKLICAKSQRFL